MRFCSLGSGSRGNAAIVEHGDTTLLFDCGFSYRSLRRRLTERYLSPAEIDAVIISHEHKDHITGLSALLEQTKIPCYMSAGTAQSLNYPDGWQCLSANKSVTIGDLLIHPMPVPHDAREPLQFVVEDGARRLALFTDMGHTPPAVCQACQDSDALMVECNYDEDMLQQGNYPQHIKERIAGDYGHLSNTAAARLVATTKGGKRRRIVAAHISNDNNTEDLALAACAGRTRMRISARRRKATVPTGCPFERRRGVYLNENLLY